MCDSPHGLRLIYSSEVYCCPFLSNTSVNFQRIGTDDEDVQVPSFLHFLLCVWVTPQPISVPCADLGPQGMIRPPRVHHNHTMPASLRVV